MVLGWWDRCGMASHPALSIDRLEGTFRGLWGNIISDFTHKRIRNLKAAREIERNLHYLWSFPGALCKVKRVALSPWWSLGKLPSLPTYNTGYTVVLLKSPAYIHMTQSGCLRDLCLGPRTLFFRDLKVAKRSCVFPIKTTIDLVPKKKNKNFSGSISKH